MPAKKFRGQKNSGFFFSRQEKISCSGLSGCFVRARTCRDTDARKLPQIAMHFTAPDRVHPLAGSPKSRQSLRNLTMPNAQNASSGFALRTYLTPITPDNGLAQRGPDEAPERLRATARRGRNRNGTSRASTTFQKSDGPDRIRTGDLRRVRATSYR